MNVGYVLRQFSLPVYLSIIEKHRVDNLLIVPPIAVLLAKNPIVQTYDLSSLRAVYCGAAPLGRDLHLQVERVLSGIAGRHVRLRQGYGLTEIVLAATWFGLDELEDEGSRALTSVGRLIPNVEAKLISEDGKEMGVGERGEILIRGPNVFDGYLNNPEADRGAFMDGWFRTGDVGLFDDKGFLYVVDRVKVGTLFGFHLKLTGSL
jgi:4-coumarate--CoA ligase